MSAATPPTRDESPVRSLIRLAELSLSYEGARAELAKYKRALEREVCGAACPNPAQPVCPTGPSTPSQVGSVDGAARLLEGGSGAGAADTALRANISQADEKEQERRGKRWRGLHQ